MSTESHPKTGEDLRAGCSGCGHPVTLWKCTHLVPTDTNVVPLAILGGKLAHTAIPDQVEHARWAIKLAEQGEFGGSAEVLKDYRAIVAAADSNK